MNPQLLTLLAATPAGRVFGLDHQTFIQIGVQLLNTAVLAALLTFILYKPVREFLKKRADRINEQLNRARDDMARAEEIKKQYEKKLNEIELERAEILESAHRLADEKSRQSLAAAKDEANAVRNKAEIDIEMERQRVKDEMKQAIIDISFAIAGRYIAQTIDKETQDKLFTETMAELEEIKGQDNNLSDRLMVNL